MEQNRHRLCQIMISMCCIRTRRVHTSFHVSKKEEPFGDKLLRFVGWLGGFYSRKQVTVVVCSLHVCECVCMRAYSYACACVCSHGECSNFSVTVSDNPPLVRTHTVIPRQNSIIFVSFFVSHLYQLFSCMLKCQLRTLKTTILHGWCSSFMIVIYRNDFNGNIVTLRMMVVVMKMMTMMLLMMILVTIGAIELF